VLSGFNDLELILSDVELFLGTFPKDLNIRNSAIELVATTLIAIEQVIGFFIKSECESSLAANLGSFLPLRSTG